VKVFGVDPGRSAAVALVEFEPGRRPRLLSGVAVNGADWKAWLARMTSALSRAQAPVYVERPAGGGKSRRGKFDAHTFLGLGERIGAVRACAYSIGLDCDVVEQDAWARFWRVRSGKDEDGEHRVAEASMLLDGAGVVLSAMPVATAADRERRVAVAEAALLAGYAAMQLDVLGAPSSGTRRARR
jgi:hypothetical protein